ncbi:MAG: ribosome maturation factor RimP [Actinomycetota bacterium]|nr:ribosome maturation factor RimP [Actinomycetota bacterium]
MSTSDDVERAVAPVVESAGLELVDVEVRAGYVKVTVDREGGVDLDAVSFTAARVSHALDQHGAVPGGRYELEVSSPGLERRLRRPEHFRRFVGETVALKTRPGLDGDRRAEGRLVEVGERQFTLEGEKVPGGRRTYAYDDLERAHTVFDWRAALAGTSAPSGRKEHRAQRASQRAVAGDRNRMET